MVKAMPGATAKQQSDIRYLAHVSPPVSAPVAPIAELSIAELFEIERLAGVGANLAQIGIWLRKPLQIWEEIVKHNGKIGEAYLAGFNRFQIETMQQIKKQVDAGEPSMLKFVGDRLLGDQWKPPKTQVQVAHAPTPSVRVDVVTSVTGAFARQRALLEGEAVELDADAHSKLIKSDGS